MREEHTMSLPSNRENVAREIKQRACYESSIGKRTGSWWKQSAASLLAPGKSVFLGRAIIFQMRVKFF
jgi:hypothetical protein